MTTPTVVPIHLAPEATALVSSVEEARAVAREGLEGDRYFDGVGAFSEELPGPDSGLTLVGMEEVETFLQRYAIEPEPANARRNIVTRGLVLDDLIGQDFRIGEVRARGLRLAEPCDHLAKLLGEREVLDGLVHRAGIRAQILTNGVIRTGDPIEREP